MLKTWRTIVNTNNIKKHEEIHKKSLLRLQWKKKRRGNKIVAFIPSAVIQSTIKSVMVFVCKIISLLLFHIYSNVMCWTLSKYLHKNTQHKNGIKSLSFLFSSLTVAAIAASFHFISVLVLAVFSVRLFDFFWNFCLDSCFGSATAIKWHLNKLKEVHKSFEKKSRWDSNLKDQTQ